jgi:hypothetical protein
MKILIGYDGSTTADAALDDLKSAGLPDRAEAIVISVAEVWLPPEKRRRSRQRGEKQLCREIKLGNIIKKAARRLAKLKRSPATLASV